MKHHYNWLIPGLTLAAWSCALVGYFGPWVGHPSAALAWNAYDLFDLLQRLPHIEHGILVVNLQTLHFPLIGLGILAPLMLPYPRGREARTRRKILRLYSRWPYPRGREACETTAKAVTTNGSVHFWRQSIFICLGATLSFITLPSYPEIMNAWRVPGWQRLAFWWGVIGIISTVIAGYLAPHLGRYRPWANLVCIALTSIPASVTLQRLLPALTELHATPVNPGWGFWLYAASALTFALCSGIQRLKKAADALVHNVKDEKVTQRDTEETRISTEIL